MSDPYAETEKVAKYAFGTLFLVIVGTFVSAATHDCGRAEAREQACRHHAVCAEKRVAVPIDGACYCVNKPVR